MEETTDKESELRMPTYLVTSGLAETRFPHLKSGTHNTFLVCLMGLI